MIVIKNHSTEENVYFVNGKTVIDVALIGLVSNRKLKNKEADALKNFIKSKTNKECK